MEVEDIDDSLYSRQRYMLGDRAMKKMASSNVLLVGCGPLGIEIAKNLVLAGIKTLTISDSKTCCVDDIGGNFYIYENDVQNKNSRSVASVKKLAELNPYVKVISSDIDVQLKSPNPALEACLSSFHCVVLTECDLNLQILINNFCRNHHPTIKFISADVYGLFSSIFCDFGEEFEVFDSDGEEPKEIFVSHITKSCPGVVTCMEFHRHGLSSGDHVMFKEVGGMTDLNTTIHPIKYVSPERFSIGDTSSMQEFTYGGICTQIKVPKTMQFISLEEQIKQPDLATPDLGKFDAPPALHGGMLALHQFVLDNNRLPTSWDEKDADKLVQIFRNINNNLELVSPQDLTAEKTIKLLSYTCRGNLPALSAAVGGICAQEVLKAITGKYSPLKQWLYLDTSELLEDADLRQMDNNKMDRNKLLYSCLGSTIVNELQKQRIFLVGCGAIGCEMLKNLAMLGVATKDNGKVIITDNDIIEKSNLNRQFLFRSQHIQKSKSEVAASSVLKINSGMKIEAMQHKICHETEAEIFNDEFFQSQDVVINALDNVDARKYVDSRCVSNQRPLVESGTMGAKGHVQIIVPHVTESYGSQQDPADNEVPYCTLKSFPQQIEHTIQWGRDKFESLFNKKPQSFNTLWQHARDEVKSDSIVLLANSVINKLRNNENIDGSKYTIKTLLTMPTTWLDCVVIARHKFEKYFNHRALQLLHAFPPDCKMEDGTMFWISPKRPPHPLKFDIENATHMLFITSTACLYGNVFGVQIPEHNSAQWKQGLLEGLEIPVPDFVPSDKKIETDERAGSTPTDENALVDTDESITQANNLELLLQQNKLSKTHLNIEEFEKDDDSNHHIDFITSSSNLRAAMYSIEPADRLKTKKIAGRIVPAIGTTTSAVAGLATIQFIQLVIKIINRKHTVDHDAAIACYRNCFLNLALPLVVFSEPAPAVKTVIRENLHFTLWDRWDVNGNDTFTLQDFINYFKEKIGLTVSMVIFGVRMIYVPSMPGHKKRLNKTMLSLIKKLPSQRYVDLTVGFEGDGDDDDEDISSPPVRYFF